MKKFSLGYVITFLPHAISYLIIGIIVGSVSGFFLFNVNRNFYEYVLNLWTDRIMFGSNIFNQYFSSHYYLFWFVINNLTALITAVAGIVLILVMVSRKRRTTNKYVIYEKHHPKITLLSLYMIPIGAVFVNAFLLSLFLMYVYLSLGPDKFYLSIFSLLPNGINEVVALLFASSLGLSMIKRLEPMILKKEWDLAIIEGKRLLFSKTTFFILVIIAILVVFSAFLERIDLFILVR